MVGNPAATADDTSGVDDEDGVTQGTLRANQSGQITVNVTNSSTSPAFMSVWADWNKNGSVETGEQIATDASIAGGTSNFNHVINVTPPAATATGTVPLRARFSDTAGAGLSSTTGRGEIEDHLVTITAPNTDFGDYVDFVQASSLASATVKLGLESDAEAAGSSNAAASGDDVSGVDDEDAFTQSEIRANQTGVVTVKATNLSGAPAYLNVWIDWNKSNGVDSGEQIVTDGVIPNGTTNADQSLSVTPPASTETGTVPMRVRLTTTADSWFWKQLPDHACG
jgi:hypothetical protein